MLLMFFYHYKFYDAVYKIEDYVKKGYKFKEKLKKGENIQLEAENYNQNDEWYIPNSKRRNIKYGKNRKV